jgi:hypothetical protein
VVFGLEDVVVTLQCRFEEAGRLRSEMFKAVMEAKLSREEEVK